jgi:hypothetical protein
MTQMIEENDPYERIHFRSIWKNNKRAVEKSNNSFIIPSFSSVSSVDDPIFLPCTEGVRLVMG